MLAAAIGTPSGLRDLKRPASSFQRSERHFLPAEEKNWDSCQVPVPGDSSIVLVLDPTDPIDPTDPSD
jgi:hypothetical protein